MKVRLAKTAGFCFGVKRAVDMVYEEVNKGKKVYTYGPIIHNEQVVKDLEQRGVTLIDSLNNLENIRDGTVVIRSHGVSKAIYDELNSNNINVVDATCPFVIKIHKIVKEKSELGRNILIIGNNNHPEVIGIKGWCNGKVIVAETEEEAENLHIHKDEKLCIVSQTTFNYKKFKKLVEIITKKVYDVIVLNTICNATEERQAEAREISAEVDAMIVIGSKHSSNTQKLYEICKKECEDTYYIQTLDDLEPLHIGSISSVGITAGASTPNNIIEEVHTTMSEMSFEQLFEETPLKTIQNGEVVEGTVIDIKSDEIILNIGYKSDGIISKSEYTNQPNIDLTSVVHIGDTMKAKVLRVNDGEGQVLLTHKRLAVEESNKKLEAAYNNKEVLTAEVASAVDGGLNVIINESKIFIPASLVSDVFEKNLSKYEGKEIQFVISEFNPRRRRIIGDRRQLLVAEKKKKQKELFERISVGMTIEGIVKNVTDFGAFVDLGGVDGLLHISEMSWGRVENPKKVFTTGETLKVLIKDISGEKVALSLKFADENPWINANEKYAIGNVVSGKVARMTDFGAFIELETGVDALLHVSQISKTHVAKPSDVLKTGEMITAKVVDFNEDSKKISLSIKALEVPADSKQVEAEETGKGEEACE